MYDNELFSICKRAGLYAFTYPSRYFSGSTVMILTIEIDLDVDYNESCDNQVSLKSACFPGNTQNILQFLSVSEQDNLQQALEDAYQQAAIDKVEALIQRKEMACDNRRDMVREFHQETVRELILQRGVRI